jgi:hypothetical protein
MGRKEGKKSSAIVHQQIPLLNFQPLQLYFYALHITIGIIINIINIIFGSDIAARPNVLGSSVLARLKAFGPAVQPDSTLLSLSLLPAQGSWVWLCRQTQTQGSRVSVFF